MSPKRLAPDIDEQMIRATVELGAREGIGKITTLKVAKACDVAEPTVYRHFDSKRNLMFRAYQLLEQEVAETLKDESFDFGNPKTDTRRIMDLALDCLVTHPDETVYSNSYRHSAYYNPKPVDEDSIHKKIFDAAMKKNRKLKKYAAMGFQVMCVFVVENLMNFGEKIATGKLEDSTDLRDTIFMLVFGTVFSD